MLQRAIGNLVVPAAFLISFTVLTLNLGRLPPLPDTLWLVGPSVGVAITGTLALSYNRSRVFFACCIIAFCLLIHDQVMADGLSELLMLGLVPLNFFIICLIKERGFFTFTGFMRLSLLLFEFAIVIYWISLGQPLPTELLDPLGAPYNRLFDYAPYPPTTSLLLMIGVAGCCLTMGFDTTPINQGMTTALLAIIIAYSIPAPHGWEMFLMSGSLFLGASIIRDSYNMAYRDELTGLPHRRALNEHFTSLGGRYSLAMLDVDHFKKFNDTHGHDVGDQVLQLVAMKIRQVGGGGKAFRYGGEEFSIVFSRMNQQDAFYYLDEVRKTIANYEMVIRDKPREDEAAEKTDKKQRARGSFRHADKKVSVTISIGVADRDSGGSDPEEVLKTADEALYAAKKAGRNQVCLSSS